MDEKTTPRDVQPRVMNESGQIKKVPIPNPIPNPMEKIAYITSNFLSELENTVYAFSSSQIKTMADQSNVFKFIEKFGDKVPTLKVFIEPGTATGEELAELLDAINEISFANGGLGFEFEIEGNYIEARALVGAC